MKEKTKTVTIKSIYRSSVDMCFDIPDKEAPYDSKDKDKLGSVCYSDVEETNNIFKKAGYSNEQIEEVWDEFFAAKDIKRIDLPKPVKLTVTYFSG